ncbi:hypothetical protein [Dactylosporangium salmoneum]|uniref:Uncharacterized protein n=1 Tax=Dactylosporangium salmoneum TaxID=53361 RepID=A0ABP5S9S8_9ACTN
MLIIHRCATCNHPDYWQERTGTTAGDTVDGKVVTSAQRRTCCRRSNWRPPETAPRWKALTCEPVTELTRPGEKADSSPNAARMCDCDACWDLWMQLTGETSRPRHLVAVPS